MSIQGGSNLSEEEIGKLIEEAEQKAAEDRRKRAAIDRRNKAQTLVAQAERRLRDAALELGPYGAERQQRSVEMALRDVQDLLALEERGESDPGELDLAVSQLQEALFGLNRRLLSERKGDSNPLQGLKNTLGSLKDELFADDEWDDWNRPGTDPWSSPPPRRDPWMSGGLPERDREWGRDRRSFDDRRFEDQRTSRDQQRFSDDREVYERSFPESGFAEDRSYGADRQERSPARPAPIRRSASQSRWDDSDPWGDV